MTSRLQSSAKAPSLPPHPLVCGLRRPLAPPLWTTPKHETQGCCWSRSAYIRCLRIVSPTESQSPELPHLPERRSPYIQLLQQRFARSTLYRIERQMLRFYRSESDLGCGDRFGGQMDAVNRIVFNRFAPDAPMLEMRSIDRVLIQPCIHAPSARLRISRRPEPPLLGRTCVMPVRSSAASCRNPSGLVQMSSLLTLYSL